MPKAKSVNKIIPNFFIIGAEKAGTTSLHYYLKQHPEIFMSPVKEPEFFVYHPEKPRPIANISKYENMDRDLAAYQALFNGVTSETVVGESSTDYLHDLFAPQNIHHYNPRAKLTVILRNPADRVWSQYWMLRNQGYKSHSFNHILKEEIKALDERSDTQNNYVTRGFYFKHIQRYLKLFNEDQMKILFIEDMKKEPTKTIQDVFRFLEVNDKFIPDTSYHYNKSGKPKYKWLNTLLQQRSFTIKIREYLPQAIHTPIYRTAMKFKDKNMQPAKLDPENRARLIDIYREDILQLQDFLQRDLSHWLRISE